MQRTLRFARYLPAYGWEPIVLTAHPRAYENTTDDQLGDIPPNVKVIRAQAWDTARHLSIAGRYPGFLARPDRWQSWWFSAVLAGMRSIREDKPHAIWSTYPIATAHQIGATLHRRSALPWVADFRDPMAQDGYPVDPATWRSFAKIEAHAIEQAAISTFTTPSAAQLYRNRYPKRADRIVLLENGYDEETFADAQAAGPLNAGKFTVLHSGIVYPSERDPTQLFAALAALKKQEPSIAQHVIVRFRAPVHTALLEDLAARYEVEDLIQIAVPVGYREALSEMLGADALLILQASNCNTQVPAKLYEYLRARKPILALTDPVGDTAACCRQAGIDTIAPLDDEGAIAELLSRIISNPTGSLASEAGIAAASRKGRTKQLADLFNQL